MNQPTPFAHLLENQGVVILDGALATELEQRGENLDDELWSARILLKNPAAIRRLHLDYFLAGADVAITASYQASFEGFARRGLNTRQAAELMQRSVHVAKEARAEFWENPDNRLRRGWPLVAASVGSYGAFLADGSEYRGDYGLSKTALKDWHRPRIEALMAASPDMLACETIPCLLEAEALAELLNEYPPVPAWISFSCRDAVHVCHGEPLSVCVGLAQTVSSVVAVGLNCTPPQFVPDLLEAASSVTDKPLVCYPNRGERWDAINQCWIAESGVEDFGGQAETWRRAGAKLIGGCCRTAPSDIQRIRSVLIPPNVGPNVTSEQN